MDISGTEAIERNDRLCENSFGALRPRSGRTVKYLILLTTQPVRAEATRSMDGFSHSLTTPMSLFQQSAR